MPKRKAQQARVENGKDVESRVRMAARSIQRRLEDDTPAVDDLAEDEEFVRTSEELADPAVALEVVERLSRASNAIVAAIADRALALRSEVSTEWLQWAFRRLNRAYAGELHFLLEAIERHGEPPLIVRVLAGADEDWSWGWCLDVITSFVERRVRAGEGLRVSDFEAIPRPNEENVSKVVEQLEGILPAATIRELKDWRGRRDEAAFFRSIGRI